MPVKCAFGCLRPTFCYQYPCQVSQIPSEGEAAIAFVLKREAIMQDSITNNSPIAIGIGVGPLIRSNAAWPIFRPTMV